MTQEEHTIKQKRILEEIGVKSWSTLDNLWKYLPSGFSKTVQNAKTKSGKIMFPRNDGGKLRPAQITYIKTGFTRNLAVLEFLIKLATDNRRRKVDIGKILEEDQRYSAPILDKEDE